MARTSALRLFALWGGLFAAVYLLAYGTHAGLRFDVEAVRALDTRGPDLDILLGSVRIVAGAAGLVVLVGLYRRHPRALAAAALLGGATVTSYLLKEFLGRLDPLDGDAARGLVEGFPSRHTTIAAAASLALVFVAAPSMRAAAALGGSAYVACVGIASVVAGGHYPSDVVGAVSFAGAVAALSCLLVPAAPSREGVHLQDRALHALLASCGAAAALVVSLALVGVLDWTEDHRAAAATILGLAALPPLVTASVVLILSVPAHDRRGRRGRASCPDPDGCEV